MTADRTRKLSTASTLAGFTAATLGTLTVVFFFPSAALFLVLAGLIGFLVTHPLLSLRAFIWLLPFHIIAMAVLFGGIGLSPALVRIVAAWKELLIVLLVGAVAVRSVLGRPQIAAISWVDVAIGSFLFLALAYFLGAGAWLGSDLPLMGRLYGFRDACLFMLLFFVGRSSQEVLNDGKVLHWLFIVGGVTSIAAVLERLLVPPELLVALGASSYFRDFLGVAAFTASNPYGLPDNYWTMIGGTLVRRAGSTYLSSQGFAVPFLLIMPAATIAVLTNKSSRSSLATLWYVLLWTGLLLTLARMTIVACVLQTIFIALLLRRRAFLVRFLGACLALLVVALMLFPSLAQFVWDTATWNTASSITHLEDWRQGIATMLEHPLGAGLGAADQTAVRFGLTPLASDNQFLKYSAELGVLGFSLHIAILLGIGAQALKAFRKAATQAQRWSGLLLLSSTLGIALNGLSAVLYNSMVAAYTYFWLAGAVTTAAQHSEQRYSAPRAG